MTTKRLPSSGKLCIVCGAEMVPYTSVYFVCDSCRYMSSSFSSGFGAEVEGITSVRVKNYKLICNILKNKFPFHLNILDVGCAHGLLENPV